MSGEERVKRRALNMHFLDVATLLTSWGDVQFGKWGGSHEMGN